MKETGRIWVDTVQYIRGNWVGIYGRNRERNWEGIFMKETGQNVWNKLEMEYEENEEVNCKDTVKELGHCQTFLFHSLLLTSFSSLS